MKLRGFESEIYGGEGVHKFGSFVPSTMSSINTHSSSITCTMSPSLLYLKHNLLATLTRPKSVMIARPFSRKMFFVFKSWYSKY